MGYTQYISIGAQVPDEATAKAVQAALDTAIDGNFVLNEYQSIARPSSVGGWWVSARYEDTDHQEESLRELLEPITAQFNITFTVGVRNDYDDDPDYTYIGAQAAAREARDWLLDLSYLLRNMPSDEGMAEAIKHNDYNEMVVKLLKIASKIRPVSDVQNGSGLKPGDKVKVIVPITSSMLSPIHSSWRITVEIGEIGKIVDFDASVNTTPYLVDFGYTEFWLKAEWLEAVNND